MAKKGKKEPAGPACVGCRLPVSVENELEKGEFGVALPIVGGDGKIVKHGDEDSAYVLCSKCFYRLAAALAPEMQVLAEVPKPRIIQ